MIDKTFRAGEKFRAGPHRGAQDAVPLRATAPTRTSWTPQSFEQLAVPEASRRRRAALDQAQRRGRRAVHRRQRRPTSSCPSSVELEVTETEPGVRGDTASGGGNKPATLETGATIQVPLFVNIGDRVKVQTETGEYMSRA